MGDALKVEVHGRMLPVPGLVWRSAVRVVGRGARAAYGKLSPLQRVVRAEAVRRLPGADGPLAPEVLAEAVGAELDAVVAALGSLERRMSFLVLDEGAVAWAFPFTATETPHHLTFATGERRDAA